jgi:RNA-dependent RNA polymerase
MGFEAETSNRLVRKFVEEKGFKSESFVRVQVCDEEATKLFNGDLTDAVVSRFQKVLNEGIVVNGKQYFFLAYSSSQLKEFSLWMVSRENGLTAEEMRNDMGTFTECNTPSKYAARIGQCLSTTFQGLAGQDMGRSAKRQAGMLRHVVIDDICVDSKNIHSDGCGIISKKAMRSLLDMLPFVSDEQREHASIVQIRYGGAKGVLVAWDNIISCDIALRKSMIKFKADFKFLECCR